MRDDGYVLLPSLFSADEIAFVRAETEALVSERGPHVKQEGEAQSVRMVFGAHKRSDLFARLSRHPRIVEPLEQAFGEAVHVFQSRLNAKPGFHGGGWAWHQDFNQWYRQDGMRTPRAYAVGIYLDDVNPCNGPLMVVPRSHHAGLLYVPDKMDIPFELVERAVEQHGIVPLMGPPGTVAMFDCLLIHGSAPNVSPWSRRIFYLGYIPASIHELQPLRDWYHCDPAVMPLQALPDDCLFAS